VLCGLAGSLLGNLLGILIIPNVMFDSYKMLYTFPKIKYSGYVWYIVMSTAVVVLFGVFASFLSAKKVMKEVPAQCMRPIPPKNVHKTWLEKREKLWNRISYRNKLIIRNILLNKRRAILSSIGVIGCVGILIGGFGLKQAVNNMFDVQFNKMQVFDDMVTLSAPVPYSAPVPFNNSNIRQADKMSVIPAAISLSKNISSNLYALPQDNSSFKLYSSSGDKLSLPDDGIVVPFKLAQEYNIKVGDTVTVRLESDLYKNESIRAKVAAIDVLYLSQDLYVSYAYLQKEAVTPYVNGYYVEVKDKNLLTDTNKYLSGVANVDSVVKNSSMKNETVSMMGMLNTMMYIMILMAGALALAVIFNISSINIFERRRDIATFKVLGYHKKEINSLVHIENLIITAFGCILGIAFGAVVLQVLLGVIVGDDMYLPGGLSFGVVAISVALAFAFTLFANFMLRGKTHRIDMVESLKSVE
jgi:putative ABC transport system permease protein